MNVPFKEGTRRLVKKITAYSKSYILGSKIPAEHDCLLPHQFCYSTFYINLISILPEKKNENDETEH